MTGYEMKPKRPKRPVKLYIQNLIVRSDQLAGIREEDGQLCVSRTTMIAKEFSEKILTVYSGYEARMKKSPQKEDERWKHLEKCLREKGKKAEIQEQEDFALELGIHKNMIGDAHLLHGERRAGIDGVCRVLMGLGYFKAADETGGTPEKSGEELRGMTDENRAEYMRTLRDLRATASRKIAEEARRHFAGYVPLEPEMMEAAEREGKRLTKKETEEAAKAAKEEIRGIAAPFGYWLPEESDDNARKACISGTRTIAAALSGNTEKELQNGKDGETKAGGEKTRISLQQLEYLWLTRHKIKTLLEPKGAWSENPNRLHVIIGACASRAGAAEITTAYHAFGLHPKGLCDGKDGVPMRLTPDFPADQVVCASIETFRPLLDSVTNQGYHFREKMSAFWGLLYTRLNHCDRKTFAHTGLALRDELFSKRGLQGEELNEEELTHYWSALTE